MIAVSLFFLFLSLAGSRIVYSADPTEPASGRDDIVQIAPVRVENKGATD
jgi:hypothetical protein